MSFENLFKLKTNPFRITPANSSDELIWAGFSNLKSKIENRIKKSIKIPNSGLIFNWGEYGSGKTHAARYFTKPEVLKKLSDSISSPKPYSMVFVLPKGKNPVYDIYVSVIDKMNIEKIRELFKKNYSEIIWFIDSFSDNLHINSVLAAIFSDVDSALLKKYLYGNISSTELRSLNDFGILRPMSSDSDYSKFLAGLFTCITYKKMHYSTIIIWIDEFEDIAILNNVNVDKTNNFLRELLDNTPNNMLIFINLTQSALLNIEDLGQYLSEAIRSRIKDRINFEIPTEKDLFEYLKELLNNQIFRSEPSKDLLFPFTEDLIKTLTKELNNASLRRYNETFSILLDLAELENTSPITKIFFEKNKSELVGWKE